MTLTGEPRSLAGSETGWSVDLRPGTARILKIDGGSAGTGFLVADRLLVTCAHVLSSYGGGEGPPTGPVTVRLAHPDIHPDDAELTAHVDRQLWRGRHRGDVAFLRLQGTPSTLARALALGESRGARGHRVKAFGFPAKGSAAGHYGYGVAGDQIVGGTGVPLLQLTESSEVTRGFSGAAVLDERTGLVVGMVDAVIEPDDLGRGRATVYVTPTETLREICPELSFSSVCPYRGLEPFTVADAEWFHGRDRAVDTVLANLRHDRRFLALLGPSGSGKSSLIHAGVLPALARGAISGSDRWGWLSVRPGADPFVQLERAGLFGATVGLPDAVQQWLDNHPERERLVLVLDQCEELLMLDQGESSPTSTLPPLPRALLDQLIALTQQPRITVIVVLRDDFYGRLAAAAPDLMRLVERALVNVPATVDVDELHAIIERPATLAGLSIDSSLVETIAGAAAQAAPPPGAHSSGAAITVLPLLEFALTELWHRAADGRLTHAAYQQIGGVVGGLTRWCDEAYHALPATQQPLVRRIVTSLVRLGDQAANIPPTRQRRTLTQLRADKARTPHDSDGDIDTVVAALADRRLLITGRDPATNEPTVELVHDALIREWGLLRQWLAEDHDFLTWRGDLEADYEQWNTGSGGRAPRDPGRLLPGSALEGAKRWRELRGPELSDELTTFIQLSDDADRQRRAWKRFVTRLLVSVSVVAVGFGLFSVSQSMELDDQRELALSRQLAANAKDQLAIDPERSLLLARQAHQVRPTPEAEAALRQATLDSQVRATLRGHLGTVFGVAFSPDGQRIASAGQDGTVRIWNPAGTGSPIVLQGPPVAASGHQVYGVAFSPDGQRVAGASDDGAVRIWDAAGMGDPAVLTGHLRPVLGVAFSPDGRRIASAGEDGTVRIWDVAGGGNPVVLVGHAGAVYGVMFSPDGRRVASAGVDGTVRVWDVAGGANPVVLVGHSGAVYGVTFGPDGRRVASVGEDGTVRVWDSSGAGAPVVLVGHEGTVDGVAFSRDGRRVASAGEDGTVRIWEVAGTAGSPVVLRGHQGKVYSVAFSPDGQRVASAGVDDMVRVWNAAGAGSPVVLTGHEGSVDDVAFSRDGRRLASAGEDGTVRIWDVAGAGSPVVLRGHRGKVYDVAFSPDGQRVASAGRDGTVQVWDVAGAGRPVVLRGHRGRVYGVAFSPDGRRVASAGADTTVRVWDATGAGNPVVLEGHQDPVLGVAFSPDGRRVASASGDTTVRVWDATGDQNPVILRGHQGTVHDVAFSPDGRRVASASGDTTVRLWDATGADDPLVLVGHQGTVYGVMFSADGKRLASAGGDTTVQIWDATRTGNSVVLRDRRTVSNVAFSPDGRRVASASADGAVRIWECEVCRPLEEVLTLAEQRSTRELTCDERATFLHDAPCR